MTSICLLSPTFRKNRPENVVNMAPDEGPQKKSNAPKMKPHGWCESPCYL